MAKSNAVETIEMPLTTSWSSLNQATGMLDEIRQKQAEYQAQWDALHARALELIAAGRIYAGTTLRDGKYMYLVYPDDGNGRKRVYIGTDKKKQQEALAGIERAAEYDRTMRQIERLKDIMTWHLDYLVRAKQHLR